MTIAEPLRADGGLNCEWVEGAMRSSFHSTINSLIGLLDYESATGDASVRAARMRGEEYLLSRRLMYRASDGQVVGPWVSMRAEVVGRTP